MLQAIIAGANMDDLVLDLDEFQQSLDMGPLAQEIAEFLEQDNTAVVGPDGGHHVFHEVLAVLRQHAAGQGFAVIDAAHAVEGPVAGIHVPADDIL